VEIALDIRIGEINNIGWYIGKGKKKIQLIQNTNSSTTGTIPKTLMEHEDISIDIAFVNNNVNWIEDMAKLASKYDINTLQIVATTNIGITFREKADSSLINSIKEKQKGL